MDITTYINQLLFPVVLFILILSSFCIESYLTDNNNISHASIVNLDNFYQLVSQDDRLMSQLELIMEEEDFIEQIVKLGNSLGYIFTSFDVERSIAEYTASSNGNYICLPLGCWQVGK